MPRILKCSMLIVQIMQISGYVDANIEGNIIPTGAILSFGYDHFEFEGISAGRKKRYVLARQAKPEKLPCCKDKDCKEASGVFWMATIEREMWQGPDVRPQKGAQNKDTPNPVCQIDDEKDCQKPKTPGTPLKGTEQGKSYNPGCTKTGDEKDKPQCPKKTHYRHVHVRQDGTTDEKWLTGAMKVQRAEKVPREVELKEEKERIEKDTKEWDAIRERDDRMRWRKVGCGFAGAFVESAVTKQLPGGLGDPMDLTGSNFSEEFVIDDPDFLKYHWPAGVDIDKVTKVTEDGIDREAYVERWEWEAW
ncbi:hypothetical protein B0J11DRAFT_586061 [Dendryphion nanum]|uniref:Uncharacterized protein n=1 Tax=Dendryphion nanum TaxID=256645 RepID=A0A9P9D1E8_9PLEO|nr:hypothetical protein B0J11DRAFT_586061 [Dendryphion nanum]